MTTHAHVDRADALLRSARRGPKSGPLISVVVASNRSLTLLHSTLSALAPQCAALGAELIVARSGEAGDVNTVARAYPTARVIPCAMRSTIPELRGSGMAAANGDIVALTEDNCIPDDHWVEALSRGVQAGADVVGGGMDNARRDRAVDWAAYFAEYGFFSTTRPDVAERATPLLTGANVAYSRRVVDDVVAWARSGEWENVAHDRLVGRGSVLRFVRTAAVYQNTNTRFWHFIRDRYEHGRDFARKRLSEERGASRFGLLLGTPLLPPLLTLRVARAAAATRWGAFLRALPATFAFLTAWSVGEAVGYLRGPAVLDGGAS